MQDACGKPGREKKTFGLQVLDKPLSVCRLGRAEDIDLSRDFYFAGRTDEELSLVCDTADVPEHTLGREDGWRAFRIRGVLDFSLTGVLSGISGILADNGIGIFAVSTFNTDYILVKEEDLGRALRALAEEGYEITGNGAETE